jgi:small-conductance mechanosensitive channel
MRISIVSKLFAAAGFVLCAVIGIGVWWRRNQFPALWDILDDDTRLFLSETVFHFAGRPVRVLFLIKTFFFLLFLNLIARIARRLLEILVRNNPRVDSHRKYVLLKLVSLGVYVVGVLIGTRVERINLTTFAIVGGTLGLGLGLGLQKLVSNFVAGLILLIEQPIRLGDQIEFGTTTGEVVRVGGRSTSIRTYENAILIVPNADLTTKEILNWTTGDTKNRITVSVSAGYGVNPQEVIQHLLELANSHEDVLKDPAPSVILTELGANAITFDLRVWTICNPDKFRKLQSDLYVLTLLRYRLPNWICT